LPTTTTTTIIPTTTTTTIISTTTTSTTLAPTTTTTTLSGNLNQPITASYSATIPVQGRFSSASNGYVRWPINSFSSPAESKRLMTESTYSYFDTYLDVIFMNNQQTQAVQDLAVGVILHGDNGGNIGPLTQVWSSYFPGGHDYAYIAMDYDGYWDDPNTTTPNDDFAWIKLDKSTSEVLDLYSNTNVTTNTLKDISSVNSFASVGPNGSLLFPLDTNGFAILAHATYQDALAQNVTQGVAAYSAFAGEGTYPKLKDQVYTNQSLPYEANVNYGWRAFVVSSNSTSVDYAIKFESSSNVPTASDAIIVEIRDANGNSVPEIVLPGSATTTTTTTIAPTTTTTTASAAVSFYSKNSTYSSSSSACSELVDVQYYHDNLGSGTDLPDPLPNLGDTVYYSSDFSNNPVNGFNIFKPVGTILNGSAVAAVRINNSGVVTEIAICPTTTTTLAPTTTTTTLAWATPSLLTTGETLLTKLYSDNVISLSTEFLYLTFEDASPSLLHRNTWNLGSRTFAMFINKATSTPLTLAACKHIVTYFTGVSNPSIDTDYDLAVDYCAKVNGVASCFDYYTTINYSFLLTVRYQVDPNSSDPNIGLVRFDDPVDGINLPWGNDGVVSTRKLGFDPYTSGSIFSAECDIHII